MKIQSVSDIIMNSSSEVFVVNVSDAEYINKSFPDNDGCIFWKYITDDLMENDPDEIEFIYDILGFEFPGGNDWWHNDEDIQAAIDMVKPDFLKKFSGKDYVILSIEDHFEGCHNAFNAAECYSIIEPVRR